MIDGSPEIAELAVDLHENLIQMPAPLSTASHAGDPPFPNFGGEHWTKSVPPKPDGLVANVDATLGQKILDVAEGQRDFTYIITARRIISGELLK